MNARSIAFTAFLATCVTPVHGAQGQPDTSSETYMAGGVKVIQFHRPESSNVFALHLYLLGGSRQVSAANAGVEPFLLLASEYGTRKYPGTAARRALAHSGGTIAVGSTRDWTTFSLHGLKQDFDSGWAVFSDRLMHPTLDSAAVAVVRGRMTTDAVRRSASAEDLAFHLADSLAHVGHPYAVNPMGTTASIGRLTVDDLRAYARDQLMTSRMLLVVVGDIEPERIRQAVTSTIGTLPRGNYEWTVPPPAVSDGPHVLAVDRESQTNYVLGYMNGPARSSPEYPAFERAMYLLSGWIGSVVREQEMLSYSARVDVFDGGASGAVFYVSTTRPDSALNLVHKILQAYESEVMIPRPALKKAAESYTTAYTFAMESASSHADLLAQAELYQGDFRMAGRQAEIAAQMAFSNLRGAIRSYAKNIQYVFVGDTARFQQDKLKKR